MTTAKPPRNDKASQWIRGGFVTALLVFVLLAFLTGETISTYLSTASRLAAAHSRLGALEHVFSALKDVQRGARGYVITGDTAFLAPYRTGYAEVLLQIGRLRDAAEDSQPQSRRADSMVALIESELRAAHETVEQIRQGEPARAQETMRAGEAEQAMDGLAKIVRHVADEEEALLADFSFAAKVGLLDALTVLVIVFILNLAIIIAIFILLQRHITQQQRMADTVQQNEQRIQFVINSIQEGITFSDAAGGFEIYNPRMQELTGYTHEEANRSGDFSRLLYPHPADRQRALDGVRHVIEANGPHAFETVITTRSGEEKTLQVWSEMLQRPEGRMFLTTYRDITVARRAEKALRESEQRYRQLFESSPIPVWVHDAETLAILAVNSVAEGLYGYSHDEFLSKTILDVRADTDRPDLVKRLADAGETEQRDSIWRHVKKDGTIMKVDVRSLAIDWQGRSARLAMIHDLTDRLEAEEKLRIQKAHFERLFDSMPEGIALVDREGYIRNVNKAYEQIFGFRKEDVLDRAVTSVSVMDGQIDEVRSSLEAVMNGVGVHLETRRKRNDGRVIDVAILASPFDQGDGRRMAYVIYRDITRKKQGEKEREALIKGLRKALAEVKTLTGLLPICAWCKKVRDDQGYYHQIEAFIAEHSAATFTHGICPDCLGKMHVSGAVQVKSGIIAAHPPIP